MLSVSELSITNLYDDNQVLVSPISFELQQNKTIALVGESGSGKSLTALALMNLLSSNLQVTGTISLNDALLPPHGSITSKKIQHQWQKIRGNKIAMVFQEPMMALNPLHTIEKQLAECLLQTDIAKADIKQSVLNFLKQVNIQQPENKLGCYPHQLSGGQRQRVMIAMALAQKPQYIIADEPTTALDVGLQHDILKLLTSLCQSEKMGLLLISHDLPLIKQYSDQVLVMQKGKVVEQGETQKIFKKPEHNYTKELVQQDFGNPTPIDNHDANIVLEVNQLSVSYTNKKGLFGFTKEHTKVVEDVDFSIVQGQALGIIGESGSGKTTTALAIAQLLADAKVQGEIVVNGNKISSLNKKDLKALRSQFQLVFQDPFASLNPRMSVFQIISEGIKNTTASHLLDSVIQTALKKVALPVNFVNRYPHELSGGQRQRVALARALVMNPSLLILDEPTSALDKNTQVAMVELLRTIQQEDGVSYLLITHDLAVVQALCHQVIVLKSGKIIEQGSTKAVFNAPQHPYTKTLTHSFKQPI